MTFPRTWTTPQFKPSKFEARMGREAIKKEIRDKEDRNKTLARKRDGWMCRFPRCVCHSLRLHPEAAHVDGDKGMGGDHGERSHYSQLLCLCPPRHKESRISLHQQTLRIEFLTSKKANGPIRWWLDYTALTKSNAERRSGDAKWVVLAEESQPRILEPLTARQGDWLDRIRELQQ